MERSEIINEAITNTYPTAGVKALARRAQRERLFCATGGLRIKCPDGEYCGHPNAMKACIEKRQAICPIAIETYKSAKEQANA